MINEDPRTKIDNRQTTNEKQQTTNDKRQTRTENQMDTRESYNLWANQYDTNENQTRDLEAKSLRETLSNLSIDHCLELGCGTGKNTAWLCTVAKKITAVDLSEEMIAKAKEKINSGQVQFIQADLLNRWTFLHQQFDLITFSLVLEHISNLDHIFQEASKVIANDGYLYVGELHPHKQYAGSKARFETEAGVHVLQCYTHHISDFINAANKYGFRLAYLQEYFDNDERDAIPRILTLLFRH